MCERAAGPGLAHSRSLSGVLGSGWGMGFRGSHHPPQVTREAQSLSSQPRWGGVRALLPSARAGVHSAESAGGPRGARGSRSGRDADALRQLALRWGDTAAGRSEGPGAEMPPGGRGSAVHRGWPGRPPEWAPCPCPEGLTKKAHVRLTVSEGPSGQRLESDRRAEAERDLGCFCACVGGSRQGRRGGAVAGFWIH